MSTKIAFRPVADAEFIESAHWYEDQRAGLGLEFIDEVQQVIDTISEDPLRYPIALRDIRVGIVSRFPFAVYYRVKPDRVVILSAFHSSRDPAIWQARD